METRSIIWVLFFFLVFSVFSVKGRVAAETMYVTDQLYLSLRSAPDPELPPQAVISSDTEAEVLERSGEWVRVVLADGRTGWVMEKYLVDEVPKSQKIEALRREIETKSQTIKGLNTQIEAMSLRIEELVEKARNEPVMNEESGEQTNTVQLVKRLQGENASLKREVSALEALRTSEAAMKRHIGDLEKKLAEATGGGMWKSQGIAYMAGIGALVIGLIIGYLVRRPDRNRYYLR